MRIDRVLCVAAFCSITLAPIGSAQEHEDSVHRWLDRTAPALAEELERLAERDEDGYREAIRLLHTVENDPEYRKRRDRALPDDRREQILDWMLENDEEVGHRLHRLRREDPDQFVRALRILERIMELEKDRDRDEDRDRHHDDDADRDRDRDRDRPDCGCDCPVCRKHHEHHRDRDHREHADRETREGKDREERQRREDREREERREAERRAEREREERQRREDEGRERRDDPPRLDKRMDDLERQIRELRRMIERLERD